MWGLLRGWWGGVVALIVGGVTVAALPDRPVAAPVGADTAGCDFDGDGFDDLAVGVPGEGLRGKTAVGVVQVVYGTGAGLRAEGSQRWSQLSPGIAGAIERDDWFGFVPVCGDFDGDGFDDLAVGVPREGVAGESDAGVVQVLYGSVDGLVADGDQFWRQGAAGLAGRVERDDLFGRSLASGDYDGDGYDDLAIGVPREGRASATETGVVQILYGSDAGLSAADSQLWSQNSPGIKGGDESGDRFGWALASGDFDGDGFEDLAVGVPGENNVGGWWKSGAGVVQVVYGSDTGLDAAGNQRWSENSPGIKGGSESGDRFGKALVSGDFDGDGFDDLAVGVPHEGAPRTNWYETGVVSIVYGSGGGLTADGNQRWSQYVLDGPTTWDARFGWSLASADFDGDGFEDLAAGAPRWGPLNTAGAVRVVPGSADGLTTDGMQWWTQDSPGIDGRAQGGDEFGETVAAGDFDGDGYVDLAIGAPRENQRGVYDGGVVHVIYSTATGLTADGDQRWSQATPGIAGVVEYHDQFGRGLSD